MTCCSHHTRLGAYVSFSYHTRSHSPLPSTSSCGCCLRQGKPVSHLKVGLLRRQMRCHGFLDQLTDYINGIGAFSRICHKLDTAFPVPVSLLKPATVGGPKLRKWYGEGELPVDGGDIADKMPEPEDIAPEDVETDAILVTDADSATGEQVVLQLILARLPVKIITQNAEEAKRGWGPYVTAFAGDIGDEKLMSRALRGVRAVICPGKLGAVLRTTASQELEHIVLLSSAGINQPRALDLGSLFGTEQGMLRDPKREQAIMQSGVPYTIVRAGKIKNLPGANMQLEISQHEDQTSGDISREDVARVLAGALQAPPAQGLVFQVSAGGPGRPPDDWVSFLSQLSATPSS